MVGASLQTEGHEMFRYGRGIGASAHLLLGRIMNHFLHYSPRHVLSNPLTEAPKPCAYVCVDVAAGMLVSYATGVLVECRRKHGMTQLNMANRHFACNTTIHALN